jgi:hypothetical protein
LQLSKFVKSKAAKDINRREKALQAYLYSKKLTINENYMDTAPNAVF